MGTPGTSHCFGAPPYGERGTTRLRLPTRPSHVYTTLTKLARCGQRLLRRATAVIILLGENLVGNSMTSNQTQEFLRVHDPVSISFDGPGGLATGGDRLRSDERRVGLADPHVLEDAFLVNTQLGEYERGIFLDGCQLAFRSQRRGHSAILKCRKNWRAGLQSGFEC